VFGGIAPRLVAIPVYDAEIRMIRYVLLAIAVCLLFVVAYFSAGWFLDVEQPQQELKLDVGPQNVDKRP